jgi:hypothetical protein
MIGRPAVLAAALIIALAADAVAGTYSDSFGKGKDIQLNRWFYGSASAWEGGRDVRKYAGVGVGKEIDMRLGYQLRDLVYLRVNAYAMIQHDGGKSGVAYVKLEMCDDEVLPLVMAGTLEFDNQSYRRTGRKTMEATLGTHAVTYSFGYSALVTLDLVASSRVGSDSALAEMDGSIRTEAGMGTVSVVESGDLRVFVVTRDSRPTRGNLDFDMRATGNTIGSWAKLALEERRRYLALVGYEGRARHTNIVADDVLPAVDKYLYDTRVTPRPAPPSLAIAR